MVCHLNDSSVSIIHLPDHYWGLLNLVRTLVPPNTDHVKILKAVDKLVFYRGDVDKAVVTGLVAEALDADPTALSWPKGWRRTDWH